MNIILVDDEKLNLENLEYVVSRVLPEAHSVSFRKGSEVMAYIPEHSIDVAFLDIQMRGIDGITIAKCVQEHWPEANIIFCTGFSEYALDALDLNCSGYLLKPITEDKVRKAMDNLRHPIKQDKRVEFHCFGNFEVYCDGTPIAFKYSRTKELLAYLVDRNGASVSLKELSAILFEDDEHRSYMYQLRLDLLSVLTELGALDILVQSRGHLGIERDKVKCDYFDYLDHKIDPPVQEYMTQFSFAEATCATLFME